MLIVRLMLIATVFVTVWIVALVMAMMPGVVWLLLLIGLGCQIARRRFQLTAFGTARFAGASDLRRAGMLDAKNELAAKVFVLSQTLKEQWLTADYATKRRLLEIVCLNCRLDGVTLCPEMRKPFDVLVEGRFLKESGEGGIRTRGEV